MSNESQLLAPGEQPSLPGLPAPSFFAELEAKGEFTGERLHQQRPDVYKAIVMLLAQQPPVGVIRIGKLLSVSPNTVMAVRDREGVTIDMVKQRLAEVAHNGALLASESILEALNEKAKTAHLLGIRDLKDIAIVYGILVQNGQLLAGQPTARVEMGELQKPQHEDFNRYLASLPAAKVIDIAEGAGTGLAGDISGAKKGAVSEASPAGESAVPGTEPGSWIGSGD
jgi:hypothetical protein